MRLITRLFHFPSITEKHSVLGFQIKCGKDINIKMVCNHKLDINNRFQCNLNGGHEQNTNE